jgi:AcrR family transcriptional regulator
MKSPAIDGRSLRAEQMRSSRREAIVRAAEQVFARHGYHDASIADVIDAADISRGTFYLYFDGKDALFLELIERFITRMTEIVEVVDPHGPDPGRDILDNIRRVVDEAFSRPELTTVVLRESRGLHPEIDQKLDRLYGFLQEMVQGALINGARTGLTRKVNEPAVATALIGACKEVFLTQLPRGALHSTGREALAVSLFELGMSGLLLAR